MSKASRLLSLSLTTVLAGSALNAGCSGAAAPTPSDTRGEPLAWQALDARPLESAVKESR